MKNSLGKTQTKGCGGSASVPTWLRPHRIGNQFALFILADKALYQQYSFEEISTIAACSVSALLLI
ncbi:MAG: hypothetical protein RR749_06260 [Comamonas sp.]